MIQSALNTVFLVHLLRHSLGFASNLGPLEFRQLLCQQVFSQIIDRTRTWSDTGSKHHLSPEVLVSKEGADKCRQPKAKSSGGRSCATMMDDSAHLRQ